MKCRVGTVILGTCLGAASLSCYAAGDNTVTIFNRIEPDMLKYWAYSPDIFALKVNGIPLKPGKSITLEQPQSKEMIIRYDFSFANGFRKGAKEITFDLENNKNKHEISFSWKNKLRISVSDAIPKKVETLEYNP